MTTAEKSRGSPGRPARSPVGSRRQAGTGHAGGMNAAAAGQ